MGFINYLINGISLGSVYAIIALGYTMVYGIAKMLNFAHGDVIMIGSYVVFVTVSTMGLPPMAGVLLAVAVCTLLGMTIERIAYKPLRGASPLAVLITAIGVSYLLQNVALLIFGADTKSFTSVVTLPAIKLAGGEMTHIKTLLLNPYPIRIYIKSIRSSCIGKHISICTHIIPLTIGILIPSICQIGAVRVLNPPAV